MKALLAALLLAAPLVRAADAPKPDAKAPAKADSMTTAEASVKELETCIDDLEYFIGDLKKKEAELDKEFKGKVPSAFTTLMNRKRSRVSRQQDACGKLSKRGDEPLKEAEAELRAVNGGSPEYKKKRKALDDLRGRLNKSFKRLSAASQ
jgi:hypothetical protein